MPRRQGDQVWKLPGPMQSDKTFECGWLPQALARLDEGMRCRLTLLSAPAGSGKSSLLRHWAATCGWQVAWVTLDAADNRPVVFLAHLGSALRSIGLLPASVGPAPLGATSLGEGIVGLINALLETPDDFALVLDDYRVIESVAVHRGVRLLLDYAPPQMHLLVASRREPPLQLPRLRVRRQLVEVGPRELAQWRQV